MVQWGYGAYTADYDKNRGWNSQRHTRGRKGYQQKGQQYDVCSKCNNWAWRSRWFPHCGKCGHDWSNPSDPESDKEGVQAESDECTVVLSDDDRVVLHQMVAKMGSLLGRSPAGVQALLAPLLPAPKPPPADTSESALWKSTREARTHKEKKESQHQRATKQFDSAKAAFEAAQAKQAEAKEAMEQATEAFVVARTAYQEAFPVKAAQRESGTSPIGRP